MNQDQLEKMAEEIFGWVFNHTDNNGDMEKHDRERINVDIVQALKEVAEEAEREGIKKWDKSEKESLLEACLLGSKMENLLKRSMDGLEKISIDPNLHWEGKRNFAKQLLKELKTELLNQKPEERS